MVKIAISIWRLIGVQGTDHFEIDCRRKPLDQRAHFDGLLNLRIQHHYTYPGLGKSEDFFKSLAAELRGRDEMKRYIRLSTIYGAIPKGWSQTQRTSRGYVLVTEVDILH